MPKVVTCLGSFLSEAQVWQESMLSDMALYTSRAANPRLDGRPACLQRTQEGAFLAEGCLEWVFLVGVERRERLFPLKLLDEPYDLITGARSGWEFNSSRRLGRALAI